jgi:hypothetical protein
LLELEKVEEETPAALQADKPFRKGKERQKAISVLTAPFKGTAQFL